jgi:DNA polymerase-1
MILLVDGNNFFIRQYAANPSLDINGNPNGGVVGFLLGLRKIMSITNCSKIVVAWDGEGGSKKRRTILKDYKSGRKPIKLNRNYEFELDNQEDNLMGQRLKLENYISNLPIYQISVKDIEADDTIGYLCNYFKDEDKIIVSGDKDFYQLLNDKTLVYSPAKKNFYNQHDLLKEFQISAVNFALAKAIAGDASDNIPGVRSVGFKTLVKMFPIFSENKKITLEDFFSYCENRDAKYKKFIDNRSVICDNYSVIRLDSTLISITSVNKILETLSEKVFLNSTSFKVDLLSDGIINMTDSFFHPFRIIDMKLKEERNKHE